MNPARAAITGVICRVRIEKIEVPLMRDPSTGSGQESATSISWSTSLRRASRWRRFCAWTPPMVAADQLHRERQRGPGCARGIFR